MARSTYADDPTARGDEMAEELREWYEENRESYWDRCKFSKNQRLLSMGCSDNFMLRLQQKAIQIALDAGEVVYKDYKNNE